MISKQLQKLIHSLELKKFRDQHGLFVAEGPKVVGELLKTFRCKTLIGLPEWFEDFSLPTAQPFTTKGREASANIETFTVTPQELERISLLRAPQSVIGLFYKKMPALPSPEVTSTHLCLALDRIQDPGNLGTIIRTANWFGIDHIFCSPDTADPYSPKVIQATMGAIAQTNVYTTDLKAYLQSVTQAPIYGTFLEGEDLYSAPLTPHGIILMGNEGKGISPDLQPCVTNKLFIPPHNPQSTTVESLNVGVATAITCAEFRRRMAKK